MNLLSVSFSVFTGLQDELSYNIILGHLYHYVQQKLFRPVLETRRGKCHAPTLSVKAALAPTLMTRNSSADEIANVNFLYDDIVHVLQNTIDSSIPPQIDAAIMCGTHVYHIQ